MTDTPLDGRRRVVIENVTPAIDRGRFPVKRVVGDVLTVEADAFTDGHDEICVVLRWRAGEDKEWRETEMEELGNDRWRAALPLEEIGRYEYSVSAWVDHWETWRHDLRKRVDAGQDVTVDLRIGAALVEGAAERASGQDTGVLRAAASDLSAVRALGPELDALVENYPDRSLETTLGHPLAVTVDPERARFSAWYELFPRSLGRDGKHGTLREVAAHLPYVAEMGFDIVYLPPIHPIGRAHRKGPNNALTAGPDDPGSPWAIGGPEGGHDAIHPALGSLDDFAALVTTARGLGLEIAIDVAFQASPDHPWVAAHPDWFVRRPDGSIQYAENPPKKYQDVYPFDFECEDWRSLWAALADVFLTWAERGVRAFRVDNPHTKPIGFWQWCLARVHARYPDAIFLSEAFTRPLLLHQLAKIGFSQSYTYFTWRTTAAELRGYLEELTAPPQLEYLRPCFWPNTPDILPEHLQVGGRAMFAQRAILAATLTASWGIYGPAFELCVADAVPGKEEYADSEKYQLQRWDLDAPHSLRHLIARLNGIRRAHPALQHDRGLRFHATDQDALLCYSKRDPSGDTILCVVNLDPVHTRAGHVDLDLDALGLTAGAPYQVHDLLGDARFLWSGARNYVELDPRAVPAHVLAIRSQSRREHGFEYFL